MGGKNSFLINLLNISLSHDQVKIKNKIEQEIVTIHDYNGLTILQFCTHLVVPYQTLSKEVEDTFPAF